MKTKKRIYQIISIWSVILICILSSCKEEDETIYGNTFAFLGVSVIDMDGRDLVGEWMESSSEKKMVHADYVVLTKRPHSYTDRTSCFKNDNEDMYRFDYEPVLDLIEVGDSLSWRFKMYDDDAEELLFEGKCKKDMGNPKTVFGACLNRNIQWYFRGIELPFDTRVSITLVRTEDGRYTLKQ